MLTVAQRRHDFVQERQGMPRAWRQGDEPVPGYRLAHYLGRGAAGEVWHAHGPGGTEVAFKILRLDDATPNLRLLERLKKLRHPHLVPLLALWLRDRAGNVLDRDSRATTDLTPAAPETLYLVTGLAEQSTLDRLKECQQQGLDGIPGYELIGYLDDAARALDYLHTPRHDLGQGPVALAHGNLKPHNLLLVGGAVQLSDTGLSQALGRPSPVVAYQAPEVLDGTLTPLSDQYSLAITYYHLRTGTLPFTSSEPAVVMSELVDGQLDLSRLAAAEQQVIRRATSRRPEARYPNCLDFVRELRLALEHATPPDGLVIEAHREIVPGHRLVRLLGKGAYGEVWEAHAPGKLPVALKIIEGLDRASSRGRQEFRALELIKGLSHNHLMELRSFWLLDRHGRLIPDDVRGHAAAPTPATLVIATRLADRTLGQILDHYQQLGQPGIPPEELVGYFHQVAAALDFLNAARHPLGHRRVALQHRDVKPDNIMLAGDVVKLTDFGLAKVMDSEHLPAEIRQDSVGFTFHYAAPEVLRGKVTRWSDQYSLAITYYELRTGQLPYGTAGSPYQQMMRQLEGQLDLGRLPPDERALIARATSVIPEERFPSCTALVNALAALPHYGGLSEPRASASGQSSAPSRSRLSQNSAAVFERRPRTMAVVLHRGEEYPPPPADTEPDWGYIPLAADTDPDSPRFIAPLPDDTPELAEVSPLRAYWAPLLTVFLLGIGLAMVVHVVLKQVRRDAASQAAARSSHRTTTPPPRTTASKPAPILDERPVAPVIAVPPPLPPAVPDAPPLFVLGKNVRDPDFAAFLASTLNAQIHSLAQPVEFDQALRDLEPLPAVYVTPRLLAFRAECHLEGRTKNLTSAELLLAQAASLAEPSAYAHYVQARLLSERHQVIPALLALEQALRRDLSLTGFRRDRALAIVRAATDVAATLPVLQQAPVHQALAEIQSRLQ